MNRRRLLEWLCRAITVAWAGVLAVPGVRYVIDPLHRRRGEGAVARRVARLEDLVPEVPKLLPVTGSRRDAWTLYPEETIGRVWLIRRTGEGIAPEEAVVEAFTSVCPHLGCLVERDDARDGFHCPCHKAVFDASGEAVPNGELGRINPTPRGMDRLECRLVSDEESGPLWVEVTYEKFEYGLTEKRARR